MRCSMLSAVQGALKSPSVWSANCGTRPFTSAGSSGIHVVASAGGFLIPDVGAGGLESGGGFEAALGGAALGGAALGGGIGFFPSDLDVAAGGCFFPKYALSIEPAADLGLGGSAAAGGSDADEGDLSASLVRAAVRVGESTMDKGFCRRSHPWSEAALSVRYQLKVAPRLCGLGQPPGYPRRSFRPTDSVGNRCAIVHVIWQVQGITPNRSLACNSPRHYHHHGTKGHDSHVDKTWFVWRTLFPLLLVGRLESRRPVSPRVQPVL